MRGVPGTSFFMPETCASGSCVTIRSKAPKMPVKTQNMTRANPIMPIVLSNSLPYSPSRLLYVSDTPKRRTSAIHTGVNWARTRVMISNQLSGSILELLPLRTR